MRFNKIAIATAMSMAIVSGMANAATDPVSTTGKVTFVGELTNTPCSIINGTEDQTVDFHKVTMSTLVKNANTGQSSPQDFTIDLADCDISVYKTVTTAFYGSAGQLPDSFGMTGTAKGVSIIITDGSGTQVKIGQASTPHTLEQGTNTLAFSAYLKGNGGATGSIVPGDFTSVADFTLTYQ